GLIGACDSFQRDDLANAVWGAQLMQKEERTLRVWRPDRTEIYPEREPIARRISEHTRAGGDIIRLLGQCGDVARIGAKNELIGWRYIQPAGALMIEKGGARGDVPAPTQA